MAQITIKGKNEADESNRKAALEKLNKLDTVVLERLAECSARPNVHKYFSNSILWLTLKAKLNDL